MKNLVNTNALILSDRGEVRIELGQLLSKIDFKSIEIHTLSEILGGPGNGNFGAVFLDSKYLPQLEDSSFFHLQTKMPKVNWVLFKSERGGSQQNLRFKFCKLNFIDDDGASYEPALIKVLKKETQLRSNLEKMGYNSKQVQILEFMAQGECNKKIASSVNLSEQGVKYHVGIMLKRFNVKNRRDLQKKLQELTTPASI